MTPAGRAHSGSSRAEAKTALGGEGTAPATEGGTRAPAGAAHLASRSARAEAENGVGGEGTAPATEGGTRAPAGDAHSASRSARAEAENGVGGGNTAPVTGGTPAPAENVLGVGGARAAAQLATARTAKSELGNLALDWRENHPGGGSRATRSAARRAALPLLLALAACGPSTLTPPRVDAVSPARAPEGVATDVELHGDGFLAAVVTDFRRASRSTVSAGVQVSLVSATGDAVPCDATLVDTHTVRVAMPAMPRGLYDVQLVDALGRGSTLSGGFSVVTPAESVARFEVQPIAEQHAKVPFPLRVLALDDTGRLVESFEGLAQLSDDTGTLTPATAGPFTRGRLDAFVSVAMLTAGTAVHVRDALGHAGDSAPFAVTPGPAMQAAFVSPPALLDAGSCQGPFHLALQDVWGFGATAAADLALTLAALPATGAALFSDASCATAAASLTIPTGASSADLWVRATLAGTLTVRAVPDALPSAEARVTVRPLPPSKLVFSAAPGTVKVGECSAALDVEARDGFDNASPPATSTDLALAITPAAGVELFADDTCATALGPLSLDGSRASVRLFIRSSATGTVHLAVSAAGSAMLAPTSADVEVTP